MSVTADRTLPRHRSSFGALVVHATVINGLLIAVRLVASYRALALDADALALGIVASAYAVLSVVAAVPMGRLIDRYGEAVFLTAAGLLMGAGAWLTLTATSIPVLAASQALLGIGQLGAVIAGQTLVGRWTPDRAARSGRYGRFAAGAAVGQLTGPVVGAAIVTASGQAGGALDGLPFLLGAALAGTALGGWILLREGRAAPRLREDGAIAATVPAMTILRWPGMGRTMVASLAINLGVDTLVVFLPAYGQANGLGPDMIGALLALRSATAIGARILTGRVVARLGDARALLAALFVAAIAYATIPLTALPAVLAIQMVLLGLGLGLGQPLTLAWVAATSPPDAMGTAIAVRLTGNRLSQLVVPALLGALAGPAGLTAVFLALAATLAGAGGLLAWRPLPREEAANEVPRVAG